MDAFLVAVLFKHGENTIGTHYEGAREGAAAKAVGHGDKLAHVGIVLAARHTVHGVHHADALLVVTVSVGQRVAAFGDGLHLVEAGIGDGLACRGEHALARLRTLHGVGTGGLARRRGIAGVGKHVLPLGLLHGHAAEGIVPDATACAAEAYVS